MMWEVVKNTSSKKYCIYGKRFNGRSYWMERKRSSMYNMGVFSYLFFSSLVLMHLFRCLSLRLWKGWPGLAQDSVVSTCSQAALGWQAWHRSQWRDWQNPWGPRHGRTRGAALHEVAHAVLQQESAGPVCSSSEAKDPSNSMVGFNYSAEILLFAICSRIQDQALLV